MFLLLIPSISAIITGFNVFGQGGNCVIAGSYRTIGIECGVRPDAILTSGIALPEPLVSWGLLILGFAVTLWVVMYYLARLGLVGGARPTAEPGSVPHSPVRIMLMRQESADDGMTNDASEQGASGAQFSIGSNLSIATDHALLSAPRVDAKVVARLAAGQPVRAVAATHLGQWLQVRQNDGVIGWVPARVLSDPGLEEPLPRKASRNAEPPPAEPELTDQTAGLAWAPTHTIPEGGLLARSEPDAALEPIMRIRSSTGVMVIDTLGDWSRIEIESGWSAWIDGNRLSDL